MNDRLKAVRRLETAAGAGDTKAVERELDLLEQKGHRTIRAEEPLLFAEKIKRQNKERKTMKYARTPLRIALVAAACLVVGVGVYAASAMNIFTFAKDGQLSVVRTPGDISEEEAREMVEAPEVEIPGDAHPMQAETERFSFASVQEARGTLDMEIPMPSLMPEMELDSADGQIAHFGEDVEGHTLWLNYSDESGRLFGLTIRRDIVKDGTPVTSIDTHEYDEGSLGEYVSAAGVRYLLLTESDETGEKTAHIAVAILEEYEYALVFFGFDEAERMAVIDSADLSTLR